MMVDPRINDVANLAEAISDARLTKVSSCSAMYVAQVQVYCANTSILNKYKFTVQAQAQVQVSRFSAVHVVPGTRFCVRLSCPCIPDTFFLIPDTLFCIPDTDAGAKCPLSFANVCPGFATSLSIVQIEKSAVRQYTSGLLKCPGHLRPCVRHSAVMAVTEDKQSLCCGYFYFYRRHFSFLLNFTRDTNDVSLSLSHPCQYALHSNCCS